MQPLIEARNVSIDFPIYDSSHRSLKKSLLSATTGGRFSSDSSRVSLRALDRVSFRIAAGDRVGLVGHNGSGKTTLLRALAGAYAPIEGELIVQGRIASLLDLSLGMDQEASGFENIYIRGIILGLSKQAIRHQVDEIAEFTELGDFLDLPIKTYSSGMKLRLAFAISTSIQADILLMDEWLSVGDEEFAAKAERRLNDMVDRCPILVLATHSKDLLTSVCNRVFEFEHGSLVSVS